ncbi:MAG TPA: MarR family winged helix-turn-helix transcriptional regulator [Dongiaceae bacterium]
MSSAKSRKPRRPQLGSLLRLASQLMTERLAAWIAGSGFEGIQPAHSAVIQPLWEIPEGVRITALAQASRITKQSMSALVSELEAAGYVRRVADPEDARAIRVRLTARGRSFGRAVRAFSREIEAEWAERIGRQRVEDLRSTLELLRNSWLPQ